MSKHPPPWKPMFAGTYLVDADHVIICGEVTDDPETRAVLLHAAEMWEAIRRLYADSDAYCNLNDSTKACVDLVEKINAEIAATKGDGT